MGAYLPEDLVEKLSDICMEKCQTMSQLISDIIAEEIHDLPNVVEEIGIGKNDKAVNFGPVEPEALGNLIMQAEHFGVSERSVLIACIKRYVQH